MATMKYPNVSGGSNGAVDVEVDALFNASCWPSTPGDFLDHHQQHHHHHHHHLHHHKILLESSGGGGGGGASTEDSDGEMATKATMDALDNLLLTQHQQQQQQQPLTTSLAELKPLPPFTGYTANLSINGIQGHHYHAIAQRIPEENNNNTYSNSGCSYTSEQNIVSSSTCNNVAAVSADSAGETGAGGGGGGVGGGGGGKTALYAATVDEVAASLKLEYAPADSVTTIKAEMAEYDISSIEDIAAIIGSAIADTTVPSTQPDEDATGSRDSWMDLDAWIDGACVDQQKSLIITQDGLAEFVIPHSNQDFAGAGKSPVTLHAEHFTKVSIQPQQQQQQTTGSTLQSLLTHGYMPLLQNRLQNGPPPQSQGAGGGGGQAPSGQAPQAPVTIKQEAPTSSSYTSSDLISTSSPPSNVVSTSSDNLMLGVNGRFLPQYGVHGIDDRIRSPDMLGQNYPHTTTSTTPSAPKKSRSRAQKKQQQQHHQAHHQQQQQQQPATSTVFQSEQSLSMLGKEKPVHRCNICNRGFLNKSNIKVHLRTHTGEKPFRCDTCAKAFRQKAHLLKHQQIHKRIGRD